MNEQGSMSIIIVTFLAVSMIFVLIISNVATFFATRSHTHIAADAAALAAAHAYATFQANPCDIAAHIAKQNNTELISCSVEESHVDVSVKSTTKYEIIATARAETD